MKEGLLATKSIWNEIFEKERPRSDIQEDMPKIVNRFKKHGVERILDLGSGAGRHTVYLAEQGFVVYGIDISEEGVKATERRLKERGLNAIMTVGSIYERLPYEDSFFDAVVCIQAINHAEINPIRATIVEIERILKPGGVIFLTTRKKVSKKKRHAFTTIAPNTYMPLEGKEKGLVHYSFTKKSLMDAFASFKASVWFDSRHDYYCLFGELREQGQLQPPPRYEC